MAVKAIIFDMGDIFYDATIWRKSIHKKLERMGYIEDYDSLFHKWDKFLVNAHLGVEKYGDLFKKFILSLGFSEEQFIEIKNYSSEIQKQVENRQLFEGVEETLTELKKKGLRLAVLSDTESTESKNRERLHRLNINQYFDYVVCSVDIGYVKPQPEAFQIVLDKLNVSRDEAIYIAHDLDELSGSREFGLRCIAVNYKGTVPADWYIEKFREIIHIVNSLQNSL